METTANGEICALPNQTPYLTNAHIIIRCSRHKKNGAHNMCGHKENGLRETKFYMRPCPANKWSPDFVGLANVVLCGGLEVELMLCADNNFCSREVTM